jgi:phospholipid/cholesterol/gamma-HCH transport system substrate-binding protein
VPARARSWSGLLPGAFALGGVVAVAAAILLFAEVGGLRGDTYRLYAVTPDARGIIKGTEVWLAGQQVGVVSDVTLRPVTVPGPGRVLLELEVLSRHRPAIRADSRVRIRSGERLIGAPVVSISAGTPAGRALADGDTVPGVSQVEVETLRSELAIASRDLLRVLVDVREIGKQVQRTRSEFGTADAADGAAAVLQDVRAHTSDLAARVSDGRGTVGRLARDQELADRARRVVAQADSLRRLLLAAAESGDPGRDSTLLHSLADAQDELATIRQLLTEPRGSAGRFLRDRALARQLSRLERQIDSTIADARRNPRRYLPF